MGRLKKACPYPWLQFGSIRLSESAVWEALIVVVSSVPHVSHLQHLDAGRGSFVDVRYIPYIRSTDGDKALAGEGSPKGSDMDSSCSGSEKWPMCADGLGDDETKSTLSVLIPSYTARVRPPLLN